MGDLGYQRISVNKVHPLTSGLGEHSALVCNFSLDGAEMGPGLLGNSVSNTAVLILQTSPFAQFGLQGVMEFADLFLQCGNVMVLDLAERTLEYPALRRGLGGKNALFRGAI